MKRLMTSFCCLILFGFTSLTYKAPTVKADMPFKMDSHYANIIEKLLFYKDDRFSVFYGGPVQHSAKGVRWLALAVFEGQDYQTRAYFEIAFVNCDLKDARDAEILFVDIPDINIKFKNELSDDYKVFSGLCSGKYSSEKYIVIRSADVGIPFYPNIYISSINGVPGDKDKEKIVEFLSAHFQTQKCYTQYYRSETSYEIDVETSQEICYKPIPLLIDIEGEKKSFSLVRKIIHQDPWKLYYIVSHNTPLSSSSLGGSFQNSETPLLRLDSGCLIGQIYGDESCDCLDQLHSGLNHLSHNHSGSGFIIHMPTHDGRGFGSAPKAETEIYKEGGQGRVGKTPSLDTIAAAEYLYHSEHIDLRTFDGAAHLLKALRVNRVAMLTDNRIKVQSLQNNGIETLRIPTLSAKESCLLHLNAKKNHKGYYGS